MTVKRALIHQSLFLQSPFLFPDRRYHMLVAGYGAGKTSSIVMAVEHMSRMLQGARDTEGHKPRLLLGGVTLGHLMRTTMGYLLQDLESSRTRHTWDAKNNIVRIGDVDIMSTPMQNPKEIMGLDAYASYLDEIDDLGLSTAEDVTFEAVKAVNERTRQKIRNIRPPFIAMGSTSQGQLGLYRLYTQFRKTGTGFVKIRGRTRDNTFLPEGYANELAALYTSQEREVYLEGKFLAISRGQVFPDFSWERNFTQAEYDRNVGPNEKLYWGQDFNQGYHRGCIMVVRDGTIYVLKRYEFPDIRESPRIIRYDFPTQPIYWIPDTTAKEEITHFTRELRAHSIKIILRGRNPLVEDSAFLVNKLFYTGRLIICDAARETADAVSRCQRDERGMIPKGVGPRSPIHDADSLRLACFFIACNLKEFHSLKHLILDRRLDLVGKEEAAVEVGQGYYAMAN